MRRQFTAEKGAGPVRKKQYRLFLLEYPQLAAKSTEQRIADQKRTILVRHLLSKVEIETISMQKFNLIHATVLKQSVRYY